jgi:hypothetical protein
MKKMHQINIRDKFRRKKKDDPEKFDELKDKEGYEGSQKSAGSKKKNTGQKEGGEAELEFQFEGGKGDDVRSQQSGKSAKSNKSKGKTKGTASGSLKKPKSKSKDEDNKSQKSNRSKISKTSAGSIKKTPQGISSIED